MRLLLASIVSICVAPVVVAQQTADQAAPIKPVLVYKPTSLEAEPGLPRTPDGRPDFQGAVWATNFFPVFETNPMSADLTVSEEEARRIVDTMVAGMSTMPVFEIDPEAHVILGGTDGLPIVRGERRTRLIVLPADGKLPLTPDARALAEAADTLDGPKDDYEQRPTGERCLVLSGSPPNHAVLSYTRMQFVQTPAHVVIHNENGDEARIIPFAATHDAPGPRSWFGDSIARWEGDTLVIDTIRNNSDRVRGLMTNFVINADAKVIERFTRLSADELLYQFTIEDPAAYSEPWLAEYSLFTSDTGMFPSPCHEHNYSLPNILLGQRMADLRQVKP